MNKTSIMLSAVPCIAVLPKMCDSAFSSLGVKGIGFMLTTPLLFGAN